MLVLHGLSSERETERMPILMLYPEEALFFRVHGEYNGSDVEEFSSASMQAAQQAYQQTLERGSELSSTSSVSREIAGASLTAAVTIANTGNIAFSMSNVEITVSERDPSSTYALIPVATLIPNRDLITRIATQAFDLGPFNKTRGPVLFSNTDIYQTLIEHLMQDPQSLVFTVSNFTMTDDQGRHLTFTNQVARDRTAGVFIDSGDGTLQNYLVATNLQANPDHLGEGAGTPKRTTLATAATAGAMSIEVASAIGLQDGDWIRLGAEPNDEVVQIDHVGSSDVTGTQIMLAACAQAGCTIPASAVQSDHAAGTRVESAGDDYVGGFNGDGSAVGLPLDYVLQKTLGLKKNQSTADGIGVGHERNSSQQGPG